MCGIAGLVYLDGKPVSRQLVQAMTRTIAHRGPDGEGEYINGPVGLGHRRLSIIDLSDNASQPMSNEDGTVWIVFNGEIYNYVELRPGLEAKGHCFRSHSDTEVIIHAYEEYGPGCLQLLNGMFSFAIWDERQQQLFCARDRLGIKPFHYYADSQCFCFASEVKALLPVLSAPAPNLHYLAYFLTNGQLADGEETFFQNIHNLLPGHYLLLKDGRLQTFSYWDLLAEVRQQAAVGETEAVAALRELLSDSVRIRLRSDVPVGTCLSGGLDSSSVVALATGILARPVKTFSVIYADPRYNEQRFAQAAIERFDSDSYQARPDGQDLPQVLPRIVWHMDGPTGGPSIYSQWHVMQLARGNVTVLLDGQGGDELLAGYFYYFSAYLQDRLRQRIALHSLPLDLYRISRLVQTSVENLYTKAIKRWVFRQSKRQQFMPLLHPAFRAQADHTRIVRRYDSKILGNKLNSALYWDLVRRIIPSLLYYEDRNSMTFSLEARVPFLDHRLVPFLLSLPIEHKIQGATTKYALRQAMRGVLPDVIVDRRDKKGYPTPAARWFRESLTGYVQSILFDPRTIDRQIFDQNVIQSMLAEHASGRASHEREIWRWLTTELWFRQFIDQDAVEQIQ
jgi:asparagine synthase (glutamine-hydrolysing)